MKSFSIMHLYLIDCYFYKFWIEEAELKKFGLDERLMNRIFIKKRPHRRPITDDQYHNADAGHNTDAD